MLTAGGYVSILTLSHTLSVAFMNAAMTTKGGQHVLVTLREYKSSLGLPP